jgi:fluoroacetyl-CoA thioesterase
VLEPGASAEVEETVTEAMTAERLGSGDVPVLGTPAVLALIEAAAVAAVADGLEPGRTTVGTSVTVDHVAPTPVGVTVTAETVLREVDGSRLRFAFEVTDPAGPIARGTHDRAIVEIDRFVDGAVRRGGQPR